MRGLRYSKNLIFLRRFIRIRSLTIWPGSRPVILVDDGAARDLVVQEAHAGVFCEPENPHDLKEKILFLAGNREKGEELGRNGYSFVTAHYTRKLLQKTYSNASKLITNQ